MMQILLLGLMQRTREARPFLLSWLIVDLTYDLFYGLVKSSSNGKFLSVDGDFWSEELLVPPSRLTATAGR
jgi:hypothetical protein